MYVCMYALVDAARHNDAKPKLGRELMILTHDDDDDVCMYVCMYVCCMCPHPACFTFVLFTFAPRMSEAASTIICGHRLYWLIGGL